LGVPNGNEKRQPETATRSGNRSGKTTLFTTEAQRTQRALWVRDKCRKAFTTETGHKQVMERARSRTED
jgi:hypothetical protein